jgi:probable HAF family extracellular repeat protein
LKLKRLKSDIDVYTSDKSKENEIVRSYRRKLTFCVLLVELALTSYSYGANSYKFTPIVENGASFTVPRDINDSDQVVGYFIDSNTEGFLFSKGHFTIIDYPKATATSPYGINNSGVIVGEFANKKSSNKNFKLNLRDSPRSSRRYNTIKLENFAPPDFVFGGVQGISNSGDMVGFWEDTQGVVHGFILSGNTFTSITFPGSNFTTAYGINTSGTVVGFYQNPHPHGFIYNNGQFTSVDMPGALYTTLQAINDNGLMAGIGFFKEPSGPGTDHGFLFDGTTFTKIDYPGANSTEIFGINNQGDIVGTEHSFNTGGINGFMGVKQ